jgi:hypothetical protein
MKLTDLFEDFHSEKRDKFLNIIKTKFKNNLLHLADNPVKALWRGGDDNYMLPGNGNLSYYLKTSPKNRRSLTGQSFVNVLQANNKLWQEFPARNASTFCTTSYDTAYEFGGVNLVLPADSVNKIACTHRDWNDLEIGTTGKKYEISHVSEQMAYYAIAFYSILTFMENKDVRIPELKKLLDKNVLDNIHSGHPEYVHAMQFINMLDQIINYSDDIGNLDDIAIHDNHRQVLERVQDISKDIINRFSQVPSDWFKRALDPEKMGCYVYPSYKDAEFYDTGENEIWFSGEYLLLEVPANFTNHKDFKDLVNLIKKD